jgi:pimeloyl-ACP methyl ester carboxylesterase
MRSRRRLSNAFILLACILLTACVGSNRFLEFRHDEPSRYYLHVPATYTTNTQWSLFIALPDIRSDSDECIEEWFEIADENALFLLCPELAHEGGEFDRATNERILADILNKLYDSYSLRSRFFIAGRGAAATFALRYAYRYPDAIEGVSAIEATAYPSEVETVDFPILLIVGQGDDEAKQAADVFVQSLSKTGTQARLVEVNNLGSGIPYRAQRLTVELFEQIAE